MKRKNRRVVLQMNTWGEKLGILEGAKHLKDTKVCINEDYPKKIIELRIELVKHMKDAREKRNMR